MGMIDKIATEAIDPRKIFFGDYSTAEDAREIAKELANRPDRRAAKAADAMIAMFMRFFDPTSEYATKPMMLDRPIVFAVPTSFDDGGQYITALKTLKMMFTGRDIDMHREIPLVIPYKPDIRFVVHNPEEGRAIIGQNFDYQMKPRFTIPNIELTIEQLRTKHDVALPSEQILPDSIERISVFAHADKDGVNASYYNLALQFQQGVSEQQLLADSLPISEVTPGTDSTL